MESQSDVVVSHMRGSFHVKYRIQLYWIREKHVTAFQMIFGAVEENVAFRNIHATQHRWTRHCSFHMEIDVSGQLGQGGLNPQLGSRGNVDVQPDVVDNRI